MIPNYNFQTDSILSTEEFREFWVQITETKLDLMIEVGRAGEDTAFMSRTWLLNIQPLPWADILYIGLTTWNSPVEYNLLEPSMYTEGYFGEILKC